MALSTIAHAGHILLLASQSASRRQLLDEAKIPYRVINEPKIEHVFTRETSLDEQVRLLTREKIAAIQIPNDIQQDVACVLAATTRGQNDAGVVSGVPASRDEAIAMIRALRNQERTVATCFILEKYVKKNGAWSCEKTHERVVTSSVIYNVPDEWIEAYLENSRSLQASAALTVAGYGLQFVEHLEGSYSGIMGLPMFELRIALQELGFWKGNNG